MELNLRYRLGDTIKDVDNEQLFRFAQSIGLESLVPGRYCWLLLTDLYVNLEVSGIDPYNVIQEIRALEDSNNRSSSKRETQFKRPPLFPLWHKHYFSAHFLAHNLYTEMNRNNKLEHLVKGIFDSSKSPTITEEMISELSHRVTHEAFQTRAADSRVTGEWLIFSKHEGANYYLCTATHRTQDQVIFDRLAPFCKEQFPMIQPFAKPE